MWHNEKTRRFQIMSLKPTPIVIGYCITNSLKICQKQCIASPSGSAGKNIYVLCERPNNLQISVMVSIG